MYKVVLSLEEDGRRLLLLEIARIRQPIVELGEDEAGEEEEATKISSLRALKVGSIV